MRRLAFTTILAFAVTGFTFASAANPIASEHAACAALKRGAARVLNQNISGPASGWRCDFIGRKYAPKGYYLIGLHSGLPCPGNLGCSTLIGWYAVRRSDGQVVDWDMAEELPGKPL